MFKQKIVTEYADNVRRATRFNPAYLWNPVSLAMKAWQSGKPVERVWIASDARQPSGYKSFDKALDAMPMIEGNTISNVQFSSFVRAVSETECNDQTFTPGALAKFDLDAFKSYPEIQRWYQGFHANHPDAQTCCYLIRDAAVRNGKNERRVHGFFVLDENNKVLHREVLAMGNAYHRASLTLDTAILEITHNHLTMECMLLEFLNGTAHVYDPLLHEQITREYPDVTCVLH